MDSSMTELQSWMEHMAKYESAYELHFSNSVAVSRQQSSSMASPSLQKRKTPETVSPTLVDQFAKVQAPFKSPRLNVHRN
mmetsp:Transcript_14195/g.30582  ORF Transcript_14195/g.30582 Transcript_14195/m.30582 type:complete len:80 (-) Transcript_14195:197-436(-)